MASVSSRLSEQVFVQRPDHVLGQVDVNAVGPMLLSRKLLDHLRRHGVTLTGDLPSVTRKALACPALPTCVRLSLMSRHY